jgi:hypothetical protein
VLLRHRTLLRSAILRVHQLPLKVAVLLAVKIQGNFEEHLLADMNVALDRACADLPFNMSQDYEFRRAIATRIVKAANDGETTLATFTVTGRDAADEIFKYYVDGFSKALPAVYQSTQMLKPALSAEQIIERVRNEIKDDPHCSSVRIIGVRKNKPRVYDNANEFTYTGRPENADRSNRNIEWEDTNRRKPTLYTIRAVGTAQHKLQKQFRWIP